MFQIEQVDSMPAVKRGKNKRINPEKILFQEALTSGKVNVLKEVAAADYKNIQQRIRVAGKDVVPPIKVSVHKEPIEGTDKVNIYFEGYIPQERS